LNITGFIDTHLHTSPDPRPRIVSDVEAGHQARRAGMEAIVIKSHLEPTAGRAQMASKIANFKIIGGVTLNLSVGGLNAQAVEASALHGGRMVWLPTIHHQEVKLDEQKLVEVLQMVRDYDLVLGTGHLPPEEIFRVLDLAKSLRVNRLVVNHPLTRVVGATLEEQKEMSRQAYLEHCYVAAMPLHDGLNPVKIAEAIEEVGSERCIMATDFGQSHNPTPVVGLQMYVQEMLKQGISGEDVERMCKDNPAALVF
jgi:predicted TIM-barrel fold metal-dependent hydrolase